MPVNPTYQKWLSGRSTPHNQPQMQRRLSGDTSRGSSNRGYRRDTREEIADRNKQWFINPADEARSQWPYQAGEGVPKGRTPWTGADRIGDGGLNWGGPSGPVNLGGPNIGSLTPEPFTPRPRPPYQVAGRGNQVDGQGNPITQASARNAPQMAPQSTGRGFNRNDPMNTNPRYGSPQSGGYRTEFIKDLPETPFMNFARGRSPLYGNERYDLPSWRPPIQMPMLSPQDLMRMSPSEREGFRGYYETMGGNWEDYLAQIERQAPSWGIRGQARRV